MLGTMGHFKDKAGTKRGRHRRGSRQDGARSRKTETVISRIFLVEPPLISPRLVPGANLSMGDMHFSQGDGEVFLLRCH
jgi:acetamidase/formamidase